MEAMEDGEEPTDLVADEEAPIDEAWEGEPTGEGKPAEEERQL